MAAAAEVEVEVELPYRRWDDAGGGVPVVRGQEHKHFTFIIVHAAVLYRASEVYCRASVSPRRRGDGMMLIELCAFVHQ